MRDDESAFLKSVYPPDAQLRWDRIRFHRGGLVKEVLDSGATTIEFHVYFEPDAYRSDFSTDGRSLMVHESCHVWQHQYRAYTGYSIPKVLQEHLLIEDPYQLQIPTSTAADFMEYGYEQQCELVELYAKQRGSNSEQARVLEAVVGQALSPSAGADRTPDLQEDLAVLERNLDTAIAAPSRIDSDATPEAVERIQRTARRAERIRLLVRSLQLVGLLPDSRSG